MADPNTDPNQTQTPPATSEPVKTGTAGTALSVELIVETGECLDDANSYSTMEFARHYAAERGYDSLLSMTDEDLKKALIKGTDFIDRSYKWNGKRKTAQQALAFPRREIYDRDGYEVIGVPLRVKKASVEAANLALMQTTLFETKSSNGQIKRKKVDVLETEFFENKSGEAEYATVYEVLNSLLDGLYDLEGGAKTVNVGTLWIDD